MFLPGVLDARFRSLIRKLTVPCCAHILGIDCAFVLFMHAFHARWGGIDAFVWRVKACTVCIKIAVFGDL